MGTERQNGDPMTVEELASITKREFDDMRVTMVNKGDLTEAAEGVKSTVIGEVRSIVDSSREHTVQEMKEFLYPHLKSLDTVLVDMEHLKGRMERVEKKLGMPE